MQSLLLNYGIFMWMATLDFYLTFCHAQLPMPINYLPKEYFLSDGSRDPRHIQSSLSDSNPYFNPPSSSLSPQHNSNNDPTSPLTTTTYHLNPHLSNPNSNNNNNDLSALNNPNNNNNDLSISSSRNFFLNPNNNNNPENNQFGARILPLPQASQEGQSTSDLGSSKRQRRRLLKLRRVPKSFRPPKEYIIYSLPEQSFWANPEDDANKGAASEIQSSLEGGDDTEANNGHNDLDGRNDEEERDEGEDSQEDEGDKNSEGKLKNNPKSKSDDGIGDLAKVPVTQKKVLLGQCMKHCIDALL